MRIFYADDDAEDREIFCEIITEINPAIKVALAKDGREALDCLSALTQLPDVIFLDINMPRMSGVECLSRLKSNDRLKSIPVVIYSTTSHSQEADKLLALGAKKFLPKGSSIAGLRASIQEVLSKGFLCYSVASAE